MERYLLIESRIFLLGTKEVADEISFSGSVDILSWWFRLVYKELHKFREVLQKSSRSLDDYPEFPIF